MGAAMKDEDQRQIRAAYNDKTIRVYQAYRHDIADTALKAQTFVSPPFSMNRMTWIKPSFLWMAYRAGWGFKDEGQSRILGIDITRDGFEWALANSCPTRPGELSREAYEALKARCPVRIQWDPERDLRHGALRQRSIQIGLTGEAVQRYVGEWIVGVEDLTGLSHRIRALVEANKLDEAKALLPEERPYAPLTAV